MFFYSILPKITSFSIRNIRFRPMYQTSDQSFQMLIFLPFQQSIFGLLVPPQVLCLQETHRSFKTFAYTGEGSLEYLCIPY